ncbi:hypothetical protein OIU77_002548 [Salix suchowensis]|uniref:Nodulin-like domain-containing protein n=1 Tax=Salix suchowensis TaxID=1278906 RepID=A0ABQ9AWN9_9ROSI|nr:hypothetical protein OIU77_002548 [Salix suchowensis]
MLNVLVLSAVLEYLAAELQLNYLAVASDPGKVFGWSSGLALMYLPQWVVLFMAAFMGFFRLLISLKFLCKVAFEEARKYEGKVVLGDRPVHR